MPIKAPGGEVINRLDRFGLTVFAAIGLLLSVAYLVRDIHPLDATYYWAAGHSATYYGEMWGADAASHYVYPPPLAQLLGVIPWPVFLPSWTMLLFVALWFATRWWSLPVFAVGIAAIVVFGLTSPPANPLVLCGIGNTQVLVGAAIVAGFRWPAAWAFPILTKLAPGIGLLWFAVRREWRSLAVALGSTIGITAVSVALSPGAWADFLRFAESNAGATTPQPVVPVPFAVRAVMSSALVVWGARTNRRWTLPIAVGWSAIALYDWSYLSVWVAALPLLRRPPLRHLEAVQPIAQNPRSR